MEIDALINKQKIMDTLLDNFKCYGEITIGNDERVYVAGDCSLVKLVNKFPVKFNIIEGNFSCSNNNLTSLEDGPISIGGKFDCNNNYLESLDNSPKYIGRDFRCDHNKLISLRGAPKTIRGSFFCNDNKLSSLNGCPKYIGGSFDCGYNNLTSLEDGPITVGDYYNCSFNRIKSIIGAPQKINGSFIISVFPETPLLKLLNIEGVNNFIFSKLLTNNDIVELENLFDEYYGKGIRGQLKCGIEMMRLGHGSNARL